MNKPYNFNMYLIEIKHTTHITIITIMFLVFVCFEAYKSKLEYQVVMDIDNYDSSFIIS